jgi:16S rRNA (guanine527-N7)-methyltransferase
VCALLDSLAAVPTSAAPPPGCGKRRRFPWFPVALARPDQVDLLDSNHKKCAFLRQAVAEAGARNAKVVCDRVEAYRPSSLYDCILSRALADLAEIVALTEHLLAPGGVIAAMKGVHPFEEIDIPELRVRQVHALSVPGLDAERHLVLVERA